MLFHRVWSFFRSVLGTFLSLLDNLIAKRQTRNARRGCVCVCVWHVTKVSGWKLHCGFVACAVRPTKASTMLQSASFSNTNTVARQKNQNKLRKLTCQEFVIFCAQLLKVETWSNRFLQPFYKDKENRLLVKYFLYSGFFRVRVIHL